MTAERKAALRKYVARYGPLNNGEATEVLDALDAAEAEAARECVEIAVGTASECSTSHGSTACHCIAIRIRERFKLEGQ